jgi:hypothetical protein
MSSINLRAALVVTAILAGNVASLARADTIASHTGDTARAAAAGFAGLCASRAPSVARTDCARIALAIAAAPDTEAAGRLARAIDRLLDPLAPGDPDAAADAQTLAAAITAAALGLEPDLSALVGVVGELPAADDPAVAGADLRPGLVRDPLARGAPPPVAPPPNTPRDPHAGYRLQPLLPPEVGGAADVVDPLAAQKAQMAEELRRLGQPVPPEILPVASERGLGTRVCATLAAADLGGTPLGFADLPLPWEIAGPPGTLHAVLLMGGVALPVPLLRGDTSLRLSVPFHLEDWRAGGVAALVVYHQNAFREDALACDPVPFRIAPAVIEPGAFQRAAGTMETLPPRLDALADALPLPDSLGDAASAAIVDGLAPLRNAYDEADDQTRDLLDALAPMLEPAPIGAALAALAEIAARAPQRRGSLTPFDSMGARIVTVQAGRGVAPTGGRVCPDDAEELAAWSALHLHAEIASSPELQNLLIGSQILAGASAGLAVSALAPASASAGATGGTSLAANAPGAMIGLAYSTYGVFIDYLDKTLPSRATALLARVDREVLGEADPDPVATLLEAVLVTESKGWDPSKAVVDLLTGLAGFLGVEGRATAAARGALEVRYARQIGRLTEALMPKTQAQADLVAAGFAVDRVGVAATAADTAEGLASSFLGWFGGDRASGSMRESLGFSIIPQTCRTDILEEGFAEVVLVQGLPDSFALEGGPPWRARALHWGDADLRVYPGAPLWRLRQADASIRLETPRTQILLGLPSELQPGDTATLTAQSAPPVADADYGWDFETGVVSARRNRDGSEIAVTTSRVARDFPVLGSVTLEAPGLLPPRVPGERTRRFAIGATRLGLRPERLCAEPGESVRIHAFDGETGEPVDPRDLVFRTIGGGRVLADGTLTDIPPGRDPVVVRARGVGANGYAGETEVARNCTCGAAAFDPALVAGTPIRAGGVETFALRGRWTWSTVGDYVVSGETPNTALRLGAYDHKVLAENALQMHAVCTHQVAGLAGFVLPFETYFSRVGPLVVLDSRPDSVSPTQAAIASGGLSVAGEDRDGDGRLDPSRNGNDALVFRPDGPGVVTVERFSRGGLVLDVVVPMTGRGDVVVGRRSAGQPIEQEVVRTILYRARFETAPGP